MPEYLENGRNSLHCDNSGPVFVVAKQTSSLKLKQITITDEVAPEVSALYRCIDYDVARFSSWYIVVVQKLGRLLLEDNLPTQLQPHSSHTYQSKLLPKNVSNSPGFC